MVWRGKERRKNGGLSDEEFEAIARRAAHIARPLCVQDIKDDLFQEVGRALVMRALQVLGLVLVAALLLWAKVKLGLQFVGMKDES